MTDFIAEMEEYALINKVPIMQKDGISFLLDFIEKNNIRSILEIGTAIGYSSIRMALVDAGIKVTTIERDKSRYDRALENIKKINLDNRINVIYGDALDIELQEKYDLIFIDAAKGKNIDFFEKFKHNLNDKGYIITDNLSFHGLVEKDIQDIESRNVRGLVKKIRNYIDFLRQNKEFETTFYDLGDGVSVSKKI